MRRTTRLIIPVLAIALVAGCGESIRYAKVWPADDGTAFHALDGNGQDVMPLPHVRETGHHPGFDDNVHPVFEQAEIVEVWVYPQFNDTKSAWISGHSVLFKYRHEDFVQDKRPTSGIPVGPPLSEMRDDAPGVMPQPLRPKQRPTVTPKSKSAAPSVPIPPTGTNITQEVIDKYIERVKSTISGGAAE